MTNTVDTLRPILLEGLAQLYLDLREEQIQQLLNYTQQLAKWNKTYNLTAIRDIELMMKRHVIDALSVVNSIANYQPKTLADIGTGGGIPGIVLAIVFPKLQVYLIESIGKKCRFLRHVVNHLQLSERITVVQQRVEQWRPETPISIVVCRAFASLSDFTTITAHLGNSNTTWLAMKADKTANEVEQLPDAFCLTNDALLNVPFETAERHLLTIKKQAKRI